MLSVRPKVTHLKFNLFGRCVHPELFEICKTKEFVRDAYRLNVDITRDGHLIRFNCGNDVLTEISASAIQMLPLQGNLISHAIHHHPNTHLSRQGKIIYQSTVELESASPQWFVAIEQQLDSRMEHEGLVYRFASNGRTTIGALSYIHVQSFKNHVLVRAVHTFPDTFAVMKSESRFSVGSDD